MATEVDRDTIVLSAREIRKLYTDVLLLRSELRFLRERDGECLGNHPDWMARIQLLLDETACYEI